ncbi:MAG: Uma2 family endonuclease [Chloroflexi bacterium]|nr:Uma2 family endonuclease [Chloroflexota bacterium]MCY4246342.1 Uma2 family endonuclease [Chloroflexota bacterium]
MAVLTQSVTADAFLDVANLPEYADCAVELVEGEIVTMPLTNNQHGEIVGELYYLISSFARQHNLGRTLVGDTGFILERNPYGRDTARGIDIAFISKAERPNRSRQP